MAVAEHLYNGQLPTALTTLYTFTSTSPGSRRVIRYITVVNADSTNYVRWWLYLVPNGDVADITNRLIPGTDQFRVKPGMGLVFNFWAVLHPGHTIQAYCDNSNVTIFIDGAKES